MKSIVSQFQVLTRMRRLAVFSALAVFGSQAFLARVCAQQAPSSVWVSYGNSGQLQYGATSNNDQMIDYSFAGYGGGATLIPMIPMDGNGHVLTPSGGVDDSQTIQDEIDRVQGLTLTNGVRGAIVLGPGTFKLSRSLVISASGVVLRGSGSSTILQMTLATHMIPTQADCTAPIVMKNAAINFPAVVVGGTGSIAPTGTAATVTNMYAQAGLNTFHVYPHNLFTVGEKVVVRRPATESWLHLLGMDVLDNVPAGCNGATTSWLNTATNIANNPNPPAGGQTVDESDYLRTVTAQDEYTVTLDEAIPDSIDSAYVSGMIQPYTTTGWINNVGVENLVILAPAGYQPSETEATMQPFSAMSMSSLQDGWVRNVSTVNTFNSFNVNGNVNQVTLMGVQIQQNVAQQNAPHFTHFGIGKASRILIQDAMIGGTASYNTFFVETQRLAAGPNVVLNSNFTGSGAVGGHQRWATGLLADNVTLTDVFVAGTPNDNLYDTVGQYANFAAENTGGQGYAHGWASAWNVVWNSTALSPDGISMPHDEFQIEAPPGATNWCVGCIGAPPAPVHVSTAKNSSGGTINFPPAVVGDVDSSNTKNAAGQYTSGTQVTPQSLYVAQLLQRVGTFRIVNQNSGLSMTAANHLVTQDTYTGATNQRWQIVSIPGAAGDYQLRNVASGELITFGTGAYGTQATTLLCGGNGQPVCTRAQHFTVTPGFQLLGQDYLEPLVINGDSPAAGAAVVQQKQDRNVSQSWLLVTP